MGTMDAAHFEAPADGGPRLPNPHQPGSRRAPEPVFNAPWIVLLLTAVIVGGYAWQSRFPLDSVALSYAFSPSMLGEGRWERLVTSLFVHGNWMHALMNAGFALAFGTPVARYLHADRAGGALVFVVFYLVCGALSSLGYAALHPGGQAALIGASGAVSGLMGAAARLMGGHGRLGPILSRTVLGMGAVWFAINAAIGLLGSGLLPGTEGAGVAWEAHIAGFIVGAVAFGPFVRLTRPA